MFLLIRAPSLVWLLLQHFIVVFLVSEVFINVRAVFGNGAGDPVIQGEPEDGNIEDSPLDKTWLKAVLNDGGTAGSHGLARYRRDTKDAKETAQKLLMSRKCYCGKHGKSNRIVGGVPAGITEFPWLTSLARRIGSKVTLFCGATIINTKYAITASHCFKEQILSKDPFITRKAGSFGAADPSSTASGSLSDEGQMGSQDESVGDRRDSQQQQQQVDRKWGPVNWLQSMLAQITGNSRDSTTIRSTDGFYLISSYHDSTKLEDANWLKLSRVFVHPDYNTKTEANDIAILKFEESVDFMSSSKLLPICLPSSKEEYSSKTQGTVAGWGTTAYQGSSSKKLLKASLDVLPNAECQDKFRRFGANILATHLCAYTPKKDTCQGDSGGPFMVRSHSGTQHLAGVTSFGIGCAMGYPGVYTRVSKYLKWIFSTTSDGIFCQGFYPGY